MSVNDLDQALWLARRRATPRRRRWWTPEKIGQLIAMVGRFTLPEMSKQLGIPPLRISVRLNQLGYSIPRDVYAPLGLTLWEVTRRLAIPYGWLWNQVRRGKVKAEKRDKKDYLIRWPEFRRLERQVKRHLARRARVLARIHEPVITKKEFDQMIGLSEVQTARYLQGKIVRAWKVPMPWTGSASPERWEWRVSKADAERVTRQRAEGKLKLGTKAFRKLSAYENAKVNKLRKARRLGLRGDLTHRMSSVIPGCYSVAAVSAQAGISEASVYSHIKNGRLAAETVRVGGRVYRAIRPEALPEYLKWARQEFRGKCGPIRGRFAESQRVLAQGYLTIVEACKRYPDLTESALRSAVQRKQVRSKRIGRMVALKQKDVRAYVKLRRRWKEMKVRAARQAE